MSFERFSKLLIVVLALALWAGTANAQITPAATTEAFSFVKGGPTITASPAVTDSAAGTTYTAGVGFDGPSGTNVWLTAIPSDGPTGTVSDTLNLAAVTSVMNGMAPGSYVGTVTLTADDSTTATVVVTLTIISPLAAGTASSNVTLIFVKSSTGNQALASAPYTVTNFDASNDSYTVSQNASCTVATVDLIDTSSLNGLKANSTTSDTFTVSIDPTHGAAQAVGTVAGCVVTLSYLGVVFKTVNVTMAFITAPLISSKTSLPLTYTKGGGGTNSGTLNISVTTGFTNNSVFAVDPATVPGWLSVTAGSWTATTGGVTVTLAINTTVAAAMATGNYSANVGFYTGVYGLYGDTSIAVTFSISNTTASIGLKEGVTGSEIDNVWAYGSAPPTMTVTPFSNDEPLPFTASCAVVVTSSSAYTPTATSCLLNTLQATVAAPLTGVAYTWGFGINITLDSGIYGYPIGTTALVTVTIIPNGGTSMTLAYKYTFHPVDPGQITISPTSVAQIATNTSMVILVTGTHFVGNQNIANLGGPSSVLPTQVYLNGSTTPLSSTLVQILNSAQILVTIPQADFLPYAASKTSIVLTIGVANETGTTAPPGQKVFANLTITNNPVIYALASTATYVQPALGVNPSVAPYELVTIFGDNFGYKGVTPNYQTAALNSYNQVPTSLLINTVAGKAVNLSVTFKDGTKTYSAPILFANQNQINLIVPSGLTVGDTVYVTVTSGATTNSSDGTFAATVVLADPGVFTLASDGTGPGAILNHDYSVNSATNAEHVGQFVQIYMTGLGAPDSNDPDVAGSTAASYPTTCALVNGTTSSPGYLQVAMTKNATYNPTPPSGWTNIDGVVINSHFLLAGIDAPCMTDNITVTFDPTGTPTTATTTGGGVLWAGFASGSVAGLYQIDVTIPIGTTMGNTVPVTVTIGPKTSPPVTVAIQ